MWSLALGMLKQFWKPIAIGAGVLVLLMLVRHVWNQRYENGYDDGVTDTQKEAASYIAKRVLDLEKRERDLQIYVAAEQAKLEGKINETQLIADSLRAQLRARRVCSDDVVRQDAVPGDPGSTAGSDGAAEDPGPAQTVGGRIVEIVAECQVVTNQLMTMQAWSKRIKEALAAQAEQ